ncbi:MAG: hypothetical protein QM736_17665 [Vicinamibacterales bacterium]
MFDRVTGQPIWPINETPVPQSDVPGEKTVEDAAVSRPSRRRTRGRSSRRDDLIDFTPELRAQALENLKKFRWEQTPFVPPLGPTIRVSVASTSVTPVVA